MGYVVIRRFRNGDGTSTRSFRNEQAAEEAARTWCAEGWEVEVIPPGGHGSRRVMRLPDEKTDHPDAARVIDTLR